LANSSVQYIVEDWDGAESDVEASGLGELIRARSGLGAALDPDLREHFQGLWGFDLATVRIHTGAEADRLSRTLGAAAFTTGQDIFFREGLYGRDSAEDLHLLAHELAHTVQQAGAPVRGPDAPTEVLVSDPADASEQEAKRVADGVLSTNTNDAAKPNSQSSRSPVQVIAREEESWLDSVWSAVTNNALSGAAGIVEHAGTVGSNLAIPGTGQLFAGTLENPGVLGSAWRGLNTGTQSAARAASNAPGLGPSAPGGALGGTSPVSAVLAPLGLASSAMGLYKAATSDEMSGFERGESVVTNLLGGFSSGVTTLGLLGSGASALGGSSLLAGTGAGAGIASAGAGMSGAAAAAGPAAAVAGAGAGGYALGRLLDEGAGEIGELFGGAEDEYNLSSMGASVATGIDQAAVGGLRSLGVLDEDTPAYQQTLGWQLAEILPSWMQ
jgi:hypothetical protein